MVPQNQSQLVYDPTTAAGNEARLTLVTGAGHRVDGIIGAKESTTWTTDRDGEESEVVGLGPTWEDIERFVAANF